MRQVCAIILIFAPMVAYSQEGTIPANSLDKLHYYFRLYSQSDGKLAPSVTDFDSYIGTLTEKRQTIKNDRAFIYHLFQRTHKKYFLRFQE